jgi:hypothetical protein
LARGIKAFKHLWSGEFWQNVCDLIIERELTLLDTLHRGSRGDRLRHGGDPEHRVSPHRGLIGKGSSSECCLIDNSVARRCHRDHTRHVTTVDCGPENLVDV